MTSLLPDHLRPVFHGFLHEIRNPMSAILTASTLLADPDLLEKKDYSDLLKVVDEETRHMNRIVNEFDQYLHVPPPVREKFDLAAEIRSLLSELRLKKELSNKVQLTNELPDTLIVLGDSSQVITALRAILINASQALQGSTQTPLTLALCPEKDPSNAVFVIRDNGEGFTTESAKRAFDPFYTTRPGATGLGLPLARILLQNNNGDLEIVPSKKMDSGACLRITLQT